MPSAALKPCSYAGCTNLVRSGRCPDHPAPNTFVRDSDTQRLYNTLRWRKIRALQLQCEPWCADCLSHEIYTPATDVDHVIPHRGNEQLFYSGRLQSLCHSCHSSKTAREVFHSDQGASKSSESGGLERSGSSA